MKHFWTILSHEIRMLLVSPATYIAAVFFLGVIDFFFTLILEPYAKAPQEVSPAYTLFEIFWLPVIFIVPLLTMKCLAEERRLGTLETLLTTPVTTTEVVLGKFFAAYLMYCGLWASTGVLFWFLTLFSRDTHLLDPASIVGGYLFIAISGLLFVSIGVLTSSLARSQAVAGVSSWFLLIVVIFGAHALALSGAVSTAPLLGPLKDAVNYAEVFQHLDDFRRGVVDTREVLFYLSGTALALILSILGIETRLLHN